MKVRINRRIMFNGGTVRYGSKLLRRLSEYEFTKRTTALLLIVGLLSPILLLKPTQTVSANSNSPVVEMSAAPISAPPKPFTLPLTNTISSVALSSITTLGASVSSSYTSVSNFFTAPPLPAGLPGTETASPFSVLLSSTSSSVASTFGSFFGFVTPTSKTAAFAAPPASTALVSQPTGSVSFDFDGDGKADIGNWKRASGEWKVRNSSTGAISSQTLGTNASVVAPADYDNDGKTDYAVFAASTGTWTIKKSSDGTAQTITGFGQAGDKPVPGNYDNDAIADAAYYRPSNGTWYVRQSSDSQVTAYQFGSSTDIPVPGNYDGDSKTDFAVYRPSNGAWFVMGSTSGFMSQQWGVASDIPVPADYDGDGKTDYAVYRGSSGVWFVIKSSSATFSYVTQSWGNYGDQPVPADYDGDGKADYAVWRPTNTVWYVSRSAAAGYDGWALGATGDTAVPSAYVKQVGGEVYSYDFAKTRLSPKNATGGTNLYSRNFSWGTGLVGLSGRAGLDAGFGVSYNSLVWTKEGSAMVFDADKDNVAPGFRFGYPTIEPVYYDSTTQKFNYLMIAPSGAKVEFRQQQGASNIYETADSSYTQLKVNGSGNPNDAAETLPITVTGTDGTQMSYSYIAGAYRCTQIKDANGNFITIYNDENGLLRTVTDTLGRVITVNYDGDFNPTTVTQTWKDNNGAGNNVTHTYATFNYAMTPMNTNFGSNITTVYGPQGVSIQVLESITFADGASTKFDYNSYAQVYKISNYAADSHKLNHTQVNLSDSDLTSAQTDCPRFSQTKNWVENFNLDAYNVAQAVVVNNSITENTSFAIGDTSGTATKIEVSMVGEPNNHVSKTYVGASGWTEGLPLATEDLATENGSYGQRRWTTTNWTQDDTSLSYILNPRATESKVGDASNVKKTRVDYITQSGVTLPYQVKVYDANQTTVLKTSLTEYNWTSAYTSRRIFGLPTKSELYDETSALVSKVTYAYDEGDFNDTTLNQNLSSVIQHDNTNYGSGFITGRGNLTSTTRWNVIYPTSSNEAVTSSVKYNTAGAAVAQITPGSTMGTTRQVKIDYTDSFNDNQNRNTFAYPKKITDPAGNFSEVKYRYDIGANVWAKSPAPANNTTGKETSRILDSIGRLQKQTLVNTGAYTRYEYPTNQAQSKVYSTVVDANNNGADAADEVLSEAWTDGAGRTRQSRTEHPGSTGGWSGQKVEYDVLGQVKRQSIPTEIDSSWNPAGDDYTRGWLWTSNEYDWKGRVTRTVNTDGTDKLISYDGCGCAGGQVTTVQGELVPRDDQPTVNARKTQKAYADVQGRNYKTETLNWDGTVYSTTKTTFDGRDQATLVRQYAGAQTSSTFQDSTAIYDGHGRVWKTHKPEQQNADGTPAYTIYNYNSDDSISSVVDARGASVNYSYNSRGLVEQISSSVLSGSTIPVAPTVTFAYDNIGNRTQMSDGLGNTTYAYDSLSRLTSETRTFSELGSYTLNYSYGLTGQLTTIGDPAEPQRNVGYNYDKAGRLQQVDGGGFGGISQYLSGIGYRAFGSVKAASYGSGKTLSAAYNNRLQPAQYAVSQTMQTNYDYYADGQVRFVSDQIDNRFDRLYKYDHLGRTKEARSGAEARDETQTSYDRPFRQSFAYNSFGNLTGRTSRLWSEDLGTVSDSFVNQRRQNSYGTTVGFDAEGREVSFEEQYERRLNNQFDAAGRRKRVTQESWTEFPSGAARWVQRWTITQDYDGDGQRVKQLENGAEAPTFYIRSSALGGAVVGELRKTNGVWLKDGYVYALGEMIAQQKQTYNAANEVKFNYRNPVTGSQRGAVETELDPLGVNVGLTPPQSDAPIIEGQSGILLPVRYADAFDGRFGCTIDGAPSSCDEAYSLLGSGVGVQCPNNNCGSRVLYRDGHPTITSPFMAYADGTSGYWYHTWGRVDVDGVKGEWGITGRFFRDTPGGNTLFDLNRPNPIDSIILGSTNNGSQGNQRPTSPENTDNISRECMDLARKIANIRRDIIEAESALEGNPSGLPELPEYPGQPIRKHREGHQQKLNEFRENLENKLKQYRDKCGGGEPPQVQVRAPELAPKRKPFDPRNLFDPRNVPFYIPFPSRSLPVPRGVPGGVYTTPLPPIHVPPGFPCNFYPGLCTIDS